MPPEAPSPAADAEQLDFSELIRAISDEEVERFQRDGWVFIPSFIKPELCEQILDHYMAWSGFPYREWPEDAAEQQAFLDAFQTYSAKPRGRFAIRQEDPWMFNLVAQRKIGEAAARLIGADAVKPMSESLQLKLPDVSGHGNSIRWHQDFPSMPIDRAEAAQLWLALVPVTVDMGPMVHLTGSHRSWPGGLAEGGDDLREQHPEVFARYPVSTPHDYAQGDAVFHHCLTYHYSPTNRSNKVRWAMSNYRMAARTRYTGAPNVNTDGLGLKRAQRFDHPNFPTVYP